MLRTLKVHEGDVGEIQACCMDFSVFLTSQMLCNEPVIAVHMPSARSLRTPGVVCVGILWVHAPSRHVPFTVDAVL